MTRRPSPATLKTEARFDALADIRRFAHGSLARLGAPEELADALVHALDEAATNAVEHGYRGAPGFLEVAVQRAGRDFTVRLRDTAPPFDPTAHPRPDLSSPLQNRPLGGLGIYLMRALTDDLRYRPLPGGGNEVSLVKRSDGAGPGGRATEAGTPR